MKNEQIKTLEELVLRHKRLYYGHQSEISDDEYDALEEQLKKLYPQSKVLKMVGSDFFTKEKIKHDTKMLSLDKTYVLEDLLKWQKDESLLAMYKIDGSSASLVYDGDMVLAKTRGNGTYGENISEICSYIPDVVMSPNFKGEVRGEIYCNQKNFDALVKEMTQRGLDSPSSLRNVVAGILGRKSHKDLAKYLSFFAFDIIGEDYDLEEKVFKKLESMGFKTPVYKKVKNQKELESFLKGCESFMKNGDYLIDGAVFSYNDRSLQKELGSTSHHPRYKMAFKFKGETAQTKIKDISWQISPAGVYTPVALVDSVELSGANISRITLHNLKTVNAFSLAKGSVIEITRSGEVIPKFLRVVKESKNEIEVPQKCFYCDKKLKEEEVRLKCSNKQCKGRKKNVLLKYLEKMEVRDLSEKRIEILLKENIVSDIPSLYKLKVEDLIGLDKIQEKLANKIIKNIEKTKAVELPKFFSALSFEGGARKNTERCLEAGYTSLDDFFKITVEDLTEIKGFSSINAQRYIDALAENKELIKELISLGIKIKFPKVSESKNLSVCITGTLSTKRNIIEKTLKEEGFSIQSSVSKNTDILICNEESSSSKYKNAIKFKVKILSEKEFQNEYKITY